MSYNHYRTHRISQLSKSIAYIQWDLKAEIENARANDKAAIENLNTLAHDAGYKTLDEYIEAGAKQLSAEDKAAFDQMKTNLENLDEDMSISHKVFRSVIAIGLHTNGIRIFPVGFKETQSIIFGLQAVLTSLYHAALGSAETAAKIATFGRAALKRVSQGEGIVDEALEVIKLVEIGGSVLVAIGVLVDEGRLIKEAYNGTQERPDLQKAIVELCARRFIVKPMQQQARIILNFKADSKSIIRMKSKYEEWVKKGRMTTEEVAKEMKLDMDRVEIDLKAALNKITLRNTWDILDSQDKESESWKDEDPSLETIVRWIKNRPNNNQKKN